MPWINQATLAQLTDAAPPRRPEHPTHLARKFLDGVQPTAATTHLCQGDTHTGNVHPSLFLIANDLPEYVFDEAV